ncbi:MAG: glycosyltransferase [bacterium]|nr:glycosyltransferase [bacterium]
MRILYFNCIESNSGWGAEQFINEAFHELGHEVHNIDYRKHRQTLPAELAKAPAHDVCFIQRGDHLPPQLLSALKVPILFWDTEHVTKKDDHEYLYQTGRLDHVFIYTRQIIDFYVQRGSLRPEKCSILYAGFAPSIHRPLPDVQKDIDVLFIGSLTPRRKQILEALNQHVPVTVMQAFGEDMIRAMNRARVALNIHAIDTLSTETRVYEVTGCGTFLLTEKLSPESPFPEGTIAEFSSMAELVEKTRYFLDHEEERAAIAQRGYEYVIHNHTWKHRAQDIISTMERVIAERSAAPVEIVAAPSVNPKQEPRVSVTNEKEPLGIVTTWFERGAAYVSRQFREALQQRYDVFIYARGGEAYAMNDPQWNDARVHWAKPVQSTIPTVLDAADFRQWLQQNRLQTVIFNEQHWWPPVVGCTQSGVKTGAYVDYYTEMTIPIFGCYDFLICNTKRHYSAFDWHPQAAYIPWGTRVNVFQPTTFDLAEPGRLTFFLSGGMNPTRKGADFIIEAFSQISGPAHLIIQSQVPLKAHFPGLSETIDRLMGEGRLTSIEKTVTAPGLYHLGDVYVYPSRLEGIGLTTAEALACGLPVITTDYAPMNEFVNEENGWLVEVERVYARHDGYYWPQARVSVERLREIMQQCVDDRQSIPERKRAARAYAEAHLDWNRNAAGLAGTIAGFKVRPMQEKQGAIQRAQLFEQRRQK